MYCFFKKELQDFGPTNKFSRFLRFGRLRGTSWISFGGTVGGNRATGGTARPIWRHGGTAAQGGGRPARLGGTAAQTGGTAAQVGEPIVRREPIVR
eukprot:gene15046-biopygen6242